MLEVLRNLISPDKRKLADWNKEMDDITDLVMRNIMGKESESDKGEIFHRARVRLEAYMEAKEFHLEKHLAEVKSTREIMKAQVSQEEINVVHKQNKQVVMTIADRKERKAV